MSYVMLWYRNGPPGYVGSLMDYNARFFSPALGRFISADAIVPGAGNPAAFNRYMYVLGNPLGLRDPSGHFTCAICRIPSDIINRAAAFASGFGHRTADNTSFGAVTALEVARGTYPSSDYPDQFRDGETVADYVGTAQALAEIAGGLATIDVGAGVAGGGSALCAVFAGATCTPATAAGGVAAIGAGVAEVGHGLAMLAKIGNGSAHAKTTDGHHSWPKYLGGSEDQPLYEMDRVLHQKYHTELDRGIRSRFRGALDFESLSRADRLDFLDRLREFNREFDAQNGTKTLEFLEKAIHEAGY